MNNETKKDAAKLELSAVRDAVAQAIAANLEVKENKKGTGVYFAMPSYFEFNAFGITGTLNASWYGLKATPTEAATVQRVSNQTAKLSPEAKRALIAELEAGLE